MQAVAWIALRDGETVERAGDLRTPSTGHREQVKLPSGVQWVTLPGKPGLSRLKMLIVHTTRMQCGEAVGLAPGEAEAELLAFLRKGQVVAHGRPSDNASFAAIPPIDWQIMAFSENDQLSGVLFACRLYPDGSPSAGRAHWQDVRIARGGVLAAWPNGLASTPGDGLIADPVPDAAAEALAWMTEKQIETVKQHGRPLARDSLARECKQATSYPMRRGRDLYKELPTNLRNPLRR